MVLEEDDFSKILAEHKKMTSPLTKETIVQEEVPDDLESVIKIHVKKVFNKYDKNLTKTADALQVARNTVRKYLD
jgi:transcriptional regulator with PAS, ATPase and Fis domain